MDGWKTNDVKIKNAAWLKKIDDTKADQIGKISRMKYNEKKNNWIGMRKNDFSYYIL